MEHHLENVEAAVTRIYKQMEARKEYEGMKMGLSTVVGIV
jgi:hypothetical protein